jgi:hypothetical protein
MAVAFEQIDHRAVEGGEALSRRRPRPERRRPAEQRVLKDALMLVEQRERDRRHVGIASVERALADAGLGGDALHRHLAGLREQPLGRREHAGTVARRVGALAGGAHEPSLPMKRTVRPHGC